MTKPNKQIYIDFILDELNKGNVHYKDVFVLFVAKFDLSKQTFIKYWKLANEAYKEKRAAIEKEKQAVIVGEEKKAANALTLDRIARMKIAEDIALGKARKIDEQIIMPSFSDRLRALDYLSKIAGDYNGSGVTVDLSNRQIIINQNYIDSDADAD